MQDNKAEVLNGQQLGVGNSNGASSSKQKQETSFGVQGQSNLGGGVVLTAARSICDEDVDMVEGQSQILNREEEQQSIQQRITVDSEIGANTQSASSSVDQNSTFVPIKRIVH